MEIDKKKHFFQSIGTFLESIEPIITLILWAITICTYAVCFWIWFQLPDTVGTHFMLGYITRFGSKKELLVAFVLPLMALCIPKDEINIHSTTHEANKLKEEMIHRNNQKHIITKIILCIVECVVLVYILSVNKNMF